MTDIELVNIIKANEDRRAVDAAISELWTRLRDQCAIKCRSFKLSASELRTVGMAAIWKAARAFDEGRGDNFAAYAQRAFTTEALSAHQKPTLQAADDEKEMSERCVPDSTAALDDAEESRVKVKRLMKIASPKEREVMAMLLEGKKQQAIADELQVTKQCVSAIMTRVREKAESFA